jgi:hypothetical protein
MLVTCFAIGIGQYREGGEGTNVFLFVVFLSLATANCILLVFGTMWQGISQGAENKRRERRENRQVRQEGD